MSWINRWRKASTRRAVEATRRAQEEQAAERAAAWERIAELAKTTPDWNQQTCYIQTAPLLTPGQRDCGRKRP